MNITSHYSNGTANSLRGSASLHILASYYQPLNGALVWLPLSTLSEGIPDTLSVHNQLYFSLKINELTHRIRQSIRRRRRFNAFTWANISIKVQSCKCHYIFQCISIQLGIPVRHVKTTTTAQNKTCNKLSAKLNYTSIALSALILNWNYKHKEPDT